MYSKKWFEARAHSPLKHENYHLLKSFEEVLSKYTVDALHTDVYNGTRSLVYSEGSANFNLFKLTPNRHYIDGVNPMLHLWKRVDTDSSILKKFEALANTKYRQPESASSIGQPYNLFLMQLASSNDLKFTIDALKYATEMKRFTVFKTHPTPADGTDFKKLWGVFKSYGLVSDYTVLTSGNMYELIVNADLVYSADSAGTFNAMLAGIPTVNYRINEFSEVVPLIETSKTLPTHSIPHDDLLRFLTWYHNILSIDITDKQSAESKIAKIVKLYESGLETESIF